jgi:hypothetical protein
MWFVQLVGRLQAQKRNINGNAIAREAEQQPEGREGGQGGDEKDRSVGRREGAEQRFDTRALAVGGDDIERRPCDHDVCEGYNVVLRSIGLMHASAEVFAYAACAWTCRHVATLPTAARRGASERRINAALMRTPRKKSSATYGCLDSSAHACRQSRGIRTLNRRGQEPPKTMQAAEEMRLR